MSWYSPILDFFRKTSDGNADIIDYEDLPSASAITPPNPVSGDWAGDKYHGGFGPTQLYTLNYWELRKRSSQLFRDNLYARGIIRRIVTNEINTGLTLECTPDPDVLGIDDETLADWAENIENRFAIWARNPELCDWEGRRTFGQIQRELRQEAMIEGDMLVILHQSARYKLPQIQLVSGSSVKDPYKIDPKAVNTITHGVERNPKGQQVAYHVEQEDGTTKRIPAYGPKSGRRIAWLVYGLDKRHDDVRGEPLLSIILQSLKEIDRYRDAALRKATINSILAVFIKKTQERMGTNTIGGGAVRKTTVTPTDDTNSGRRFGVTEHVPGTFIEELQVGEEPTPHSTAGTDVNFGPFEDSIITAIAWCLEIPPEILRLAFSNNYSASAAAINEYKMSLNMRRLGVGETLCSPVYVEWFLSEILLGKITAAGFLESWNNPKAYDIYGAWIDSDWTGAIKPATDLVKVTKGYKAMIDEGWITNERAARELTGTKFRKNIKRIKRENELKLEAAQVLTPLEEGAQTQENESAAVLSLCDKVDDLTDKLEEING